MHAENQLVDIKYRMHNERENIPENTDSCNYLALLTWLDQLGLSKSIADRDDDASVTAIMGIFYDIEFQGINYI